MHSPRIVVDHARFAHDTVDDETMIIDTVTGQLVLLDGIATTLWDHLRATATVDELVEQVRGRFGEEAAAETRSFLAELHDTGLVIDAPEPEPEPADTPAGDPTGAEAAWPSSYAPPTIERIDEIADIMAMDPIHDVDASLGWPHTRPGAIG
ncbi:MAG: PqqD family protein [Acidimicrobiales bacterium]|jgi:hypothetical protein|nr:PqqD family protein [Acidimicrobiales bacterium]